MFASECLELGSKRRILGFFDGALERGNKVLSGIRNKNLVAELRNIFREISSHGRYPRRTVFVQLHWVHCRGEFVLLERDNCRSEKMKVLRDSFVAAKPKKVNI